MNKRPSKKPLSNRLADSITGFLGSWKGFAFHVIIIGTWISLNTFVDALRFDPFPFIFLNLALSTEAAISACFVLMSQNRAAAVDRRTLEDSYVHNLEAKLSMAELADKLDKIEYLIKRTSKNNGQEKEV
jgi:uncharacterized membrane protein